MRDTTKTLILGLAAVAATVSTCAYAMCQDVFDPMSGKWVYVCKEAPSPTPYPQCRNEFDPMNGKWVLVCH
jgi:hypothetical protein